MMRRRFLTVIVVWSSLVVAANAQTWDGGGVAGGAVTWTTAANWNPDGVPANNGTANIVMAGTIDTSNTVDIPFDIGSLAFNNTAGAFVISGAGLTIRSGGIANFDTQLQTINVPLILNGSQIWNATSGDISIGNTLNLVTSQLTVAGGNDVNLLATVANSGGSITMNGSGSLTLGAANLFSGGVMLNAGGIVVGNNAALGTGTLFINGGSLQASGTSRNLANTVALGGDFTVGGTVGIIFSGAATLTGNRIATIDNTATTTFSGVIFENAAGRSFTKAGSGLLSIGGSAANTYTGATNVNAGTLALGKTAGMNAIAGALNIGDGAGGANADAVLHLASNQISDSSTVTISSSGQLNLNGFSESIGSLNFTGSGNVTTGAGALTVSNPVSINSGAQINVAANGLLSTTSNLNVGTATTGGTLSIQGTGAGATIGGASTFTIGHATTGTGAINIGTATNGGTLTTGTGQITINPTGTVNIGSGANTGTFNANGDLTIDGGILTRALGSTLTLATGKALMIQNGGRASFTGDYTTTGGTYTIIGGGSKLETLSGNISIDHLTGMPVNVQSGGSLSAAGALNIGVNNNSTLIVDGLGSSATASGVSSSVWGFTGQGTGHAASVTFRNGSTGSFGALALAGSAQPGTIANVHVESDADLTVGNLSVGLVGGHSTFASVLIQGSGSSITQTGASTLTVGHSTGGLEDDAPASISMGNSSGGSNAMFTTGTGQISIRHSGIVNIGDSTSTGTFNANGNVTIDGGALNCGSGSNFSLASGRTLSIFNGGRATFAGDYGGASNATYNINGAGTKLESLGANGIAINFGSVINVVVGGLLSANGAIDVATGGNSTLSVDGANSSAVAALSSSWGRTGGTANVSFNNNATGSFGGGVELAQDTDPGTTSIVNIASGADLTLGHLSLANQGGANTSATLTVTGAGSSVTLGAGGSLIAGHGALGTAVLNVLDDAVLTVGTGGTSTINATTTININGGTVDLKTLIYNGGTFNFIAGSLSYLGNLTVGSAGMLGSNLILNADQKLTLSGMTTIDAGRALALNGGTLITGTLIVNGSFVFNSGTLGITQASASINTPIVTGSPTTINISANNISLGNAASFTGFNHQGTLNVGANAVTLNSAGYAKLGVLTSLNGGTINAPNGVTFGSGSSLIGHGAVNTRVAAELGSVVEADGALALGDGASPAGYVSSGELRAKQFAVTLNSSIQATLGNLTTLGSGASPGTLNATNGLVVDFGHAITGFGTVNSTNTLAKRTIINGAAQGNSVAQPLTFIGYVKGVGTFDNVTFAGTFDPGLSPTLITAGNLAFSPTSTLNIELGGLNRGSTYDAILASGQLTLAGTLQISLINGLNLSAGNSFDILDWASLADTFNTLELPTLGANLMWNATQLYTTGTLFVGLAGDYNLNGVVDAADYVVWRKNNGSQTDYSTWRLNYGQPAGSGGGSAVAIQAAVPEPASAWLLILGTAAVTWRRRRNASRIPLSR